MDSYQLRVAERVTKRVVHHSAELTSGRTQEQLLIVTLYRVPGAGGTYENDIPPLATFFAQSLSLDFRHRNS
jgi:hypothetical protein